ncbi:retrovirus-related Pol polyprotein from transposon 17.6 [Trichonephila clavipes]|nr:retrovirus-related Pol polyprotein from transposon 17.6 [Trichonephila clavipes]
MENFRRRSTSWLKTSDCRNKKCYGKKKRASNPRKIIALTAKEIESSSSPNKISESHTSKMDTMNEIKIKQEENLDADEEKLQQPITIIKNDIRFEDLLTFFQKFNLEIPIQTFFRNFESTCDSYNIPEKQKILFIIKLVDGAVKTYIQSQSIPKSFYELKNNLTREFGTQVNPAEIHLQLSKTEITSKETHIEYFYRVKEIASMINMEEEAEKYYIIRGLKENRATEIQLQSCSNIEELKEKMKLLDIQEKSKSSKNEVIYPKYPKTRIPYHTNQFAHRQQYGGWNWRNDQSQHPDTITNTRYKRPTLYPRNQRFPQRPTVLRPNAPTFYPRQRTQNNNTVFQPHQTRELMIIQGRINFKQVDVLLDTGSSVNIIPKIIISQIKGYHNVEYIKTKIATINGEIEESEAITLQLKIGEIINDIKFLLVNVELKYLIISNKTMSISELNINFSDYKILQKGKKNNLKNYESKKNIKENETLKFSNNKIITKKTDNAFNIEIIPNSDYNIINMIIDKYKHVFAKNKFDVGELKCNSPKIILTSELPIANRPYRTYFKDDTEIKKQLDALLKAGIIKPSYSSYAAPITLAFKNEDNARTRLCIDYRKLNAITKLDAEPIPLIDAVLNKLTHAKCFSTIDLCSGYWHIKLDDNESEKLAFTSNYGLFQFNRLPFGYKISPAIFQRAIRQILNKYHIKFALNYFDDIIVFSESVEEHAKLLEEIFKICGIENIKLKFSKCKFGKDTIEFLRYEIKQGSYTPNNTNVEIIKKLLPPRNVKDLQRFLGSINVYYKFIPQYAKLRMPLNNLLKKNQNWNWTPECQQSFQKLKDRLISKPILAIFNPNYPCHLYVEASKTAISCILKQQKPNDNQHPIAFHSRRLRNYEINYTITDLECLAIIDSLDKFHCYLHGSHFTVHTDHNALVWLKNFKNPTGRLFRWSLKVSMYDFDLKYKKGSTIVEADMLTRNLLLLII